MTATLGLTMPLMMLGWGLVILIGGVVAFSVYAILAGNREEKQYKSSALPETEMMQELKASVEESNTDADSLESVDLDSMAPNAPLPVPVAMPDAGADMSAPALPGPSVPDMGLPGPDSQWPAVDYAGPTGAPQAMPSPIGAPQGMPGLTGAPQGMPMPDMGMPGAPSAPQPAGAAFPSMPTLGAATMPTLGGAASPGAANMPGAGDVLSTLDGMIDSAGAGSGQAAAPVNPFKGR